MERNGLGKRGVGVRAEKGTQEKKSHAGWGGEKMLKGYIKKDKGSLGKVKKSQEWRQGVDQEKGIDNPSGKRLGGGERLGRGERMAPVQISLHHPGSL